LRSLQANKDSEKQKDEPATVDHQQQEPPMATTAAAIAAQPDSQPMHAAKRVRTSRAAAAGAARGASDSKPATPASTPRRGQKGEMPTQSAQSDAAEAPIVAPTSGPDSQSPKIGGGIGVSAVSAAIPAVQAAEDQKPINGADSNMDEPSFNDPCVQPVTKPDADVDVDDVDPASVAVLPPDAAVPFVESHVTRGDSGLELGSTTLPSGPDSTSHGHSVHEDYNLGCA
jgi:hypothetical protein